MLSNLMLWLDSKLWQNKLWYRIRGMERKRKEGNAILRKVFDMCKEPSKLEEGVLHLSENSYPSLIPDYRVINMRRSSQEAGNKREAANNENII